MFGRLYPLVLGCVAFLLSLLPAAAQTTPTPSATPDQPISIFTYDTCAPPCWFGLLPGVSTSEDAMRLLQTSDAIGLPRGSEFIEGEVDPETGYIINGRYRFNLRPIEIILLSYCCELSSIEIRDELVYQINIAVTEHITVSEALNALGQPDQVRLNGVIYTFWIDFIYLEPRLRISFESPDSEIAECRISQIESLFSGQLAVYFSQEAALELIRSPDLLELQPALTAYLGEERYVPPETWEQWLAGEVDRSCGEVRSELPNEMILPEFPLDLTPTPSP